MLLCRGGFSFGLFCAVNIQLHFIKIDSFLGKKDIQNNIKTEDDKIIDHRAIWMHHDGH